jgi:hypothetical protein
MYILDDALAEDPPWDVIARATRVDDSRLLELK